MHLHRLVLFALAAPILAVGVVLWLFLPGSIGGITYTPSEFNRQAQLEAWYWTDHDVTVRGYARVVPCHEACSRSSELVLSDARPSPSGSATPDPARDIIVLPQTESWWHAALRKVLPQIVGAPLETADAGRVVTVSGRLRLGFTPGEIPIMQPSSL